MVTKFNGSYAVKCNRCGGLAPLWGDVDTARHQARHAGWRVSRPTDEGDWNTSDLCDECRMAKVRCFVPSRPDKTTIVKWVWTMGGGIKVHYADGTINKSWWTLPELLKFKADKGDGLPVIEKLPEHVPDVRHNTPF